MAKRLVSLLGRMALGLCLLGIAALLGACGGGTGVDDSSGTPAVRLDIRSFSYSPPSPIHPGEMLTFTSRILEPNVVSVQALASGESHGELRVNLHDDGVAPDETAGDLMYTGAAVWDPALGTGIMAVSLSVQATVNGTPVLDKRLAPWLHVDP
jgi:hypothetical protein